MCGIFGYVGQTRTDLIDAFNSISGRGPESSDIRRINAMDETDHVIFGFHRLSIITGAFETPNPDGMQPMWRDNATVVCNGEIYNWKHIAKQYGLNLTSGSDCEVIPLLFRKMIFANLVKSLDAEFAMLVYDHITGHVWVARDPFGVRPLFIGYVYDGAKMTGIAFASELKALNFCTFAEQYPPGCYSLFNSRIELERPIFNKYHNVSPFNLSRTKLNNYTGTEKVIREIISWSNILRDVFVRAVKKRLCADREVGCLLSGGLDSSLVYATAVRICSTNRLVDSRASINSFSIGIDDSSTDLKYARMVAQHYNMTAFHHEVVEHPNTFLNEIPDTVYRIGTYDTTTIRASVGNSRISKFIAENTTTKVVLNGDGSDEIFGGYRYFAFAPTADDFHRETIRLRDDIALFDVLRSDHSMSGYGLEARTPFLDKSLVRIVESIPPIYKEFGDRSLFPMEKFILRLAFSDNRDSIIARYIKTGLFFVSEYEHTNESYLPGDVLWRSKEAFSDGVSALNRSWYQIINDYLSSYNFDAEEGYTKEQTYYRNLYRQYYPNRGLTQYYWMPKWVNATDPSARTLKNYTS